jgi:hypothetical protein
VFSLFESTTRLAAFNPGKSRSPTSIYLCRRPQIFDPEIDLQIWFQSVRKSSFVEFVLGKR